MERELTTSPASWLVQTKLQPPELHADVNGRPRLVEALVRAVQSTRLTLLSAPAGYGKTTLLASLPAAVPDMPIAWISLDEEDNDPARFIVALVEVIRRLDPSCCSTTQVLLESLSNPVPELRRIIGVMINEIIEILPDPFVVVVDDLHIITEPAIFTALDYLLERMPAQMHLVIATRHDPPLSLARLRAHRNVAEIRLADLRFTFDEIDEFLNDSLQLNLTVEQLTALQTRTEGWAAGLSLVVSSLVTVDDDVDRDVFIQQVTESDHYVFDFLAQEVLNGQDDEARDFLLRTSILQELTPRLCQAVTGRINAGDILLDLHRRNLFVITVDARQQTYRYHDLFQVFLREQLQRTLPDLLPEIHCQAARAETVAERALHHYQAAGMWMEAADLVEVHGDSLVQQGSFDTLRSWISAFPEPMLPQRPWLSYLLGVCAWESLDVGNARDHLHTALAGFEAEGNEVGAGEALVYLTNYLTTIGDIPTATETAERALTLPIPTHLRVFLLATRAWLNVLGRKWDASAVDLENALAIVESSNDPRSLSTLATRLHPPYSVLPGGLRQLERFCELALVRVAGTPSPVAGAVHGLTAWTHLWRGDIVAAVDAGERAWLDSTQFGGQLWVNTDVGSLLPICYSLLNDDERAETHAENLSAELEKPATERFAAAWLALYYWHLARFRWQQGRIDDARNIHARMLSRKHPNERPGAEIARAMLDGLIALSDGRHADAEVAFEEAAARQAEMPTTTLAGQAILLLAFLRLHQQRPDDALAILEPVLERHEREETPGMILWNGRVIVAPLLELAVKHQVHPEFARRTLGLIGENAAVRGQVSVPETGDSLTAREIEVLRLIATGAGNLAIADELFISIHTVKRHVANLLNKLGVSSRTQAAIRARELGIL